MSHPCRYSPSSRSSRSSSSSSPTSHVRVIVIASRFSCKTPFRACACPTRFEGRRCLQRFRHRGSEGLRTQSTKGPFRSFLQPCVLLYGVVREDGQLKESPCTCMPAVACASKRASERPSL